jgi:hypothetical protein
VIQAFESAVGSVEEKGFSDIVKSARSPEEFERLVQSHEGGSGFMRFLTIDHGSWTKKFEGGGLRGIAYTIGNPLIARTMLRHELAAGLNVPVRVYIYESKDGKTRLAYHEPSSLMSVYGNEEVTEACKALDAKLATLAAQVTGSAA